MSQETPEAKKLFASSFHDFSSLPEGQREMLLRAIQFFPPTKCLPFITVDSLNFCISVLAQKGPVYEAAIEAGLALIPALFFAEHNENSEENSLKTEKTAENSFENQDKEAPIKPKDPIPATASALLAAIYHPSESTREGVVQLIARLLFALAEADPPKLADSARTAEIEKSLFDADRLSRATKLKLLAALYYSRHDGFSVAKLANEAWVGLVARKRRVFELILPFFSKAICYNLSLKQNQGVARKVLAAVTSDRMAPLFMATLERQTRNSDAVVRRGMVCGVNEILLCATKTRSVDESAAKIAVAALYDSDASVRVAGAEVLRTLFGRGGREAFRGLLEEMFEVGEKSDPLSEKSGILVDKCDVSGEKSDIVFEKVDVSDENRDFGIRQLASAFESLTKVLMRENESNECREICARFVLNECVAKWSGRRRDYNRMDVVKDAVRLDPKALSENFATVFDFLVALFDDCSNEKVIFFMFFSFILFSTFFVLFYCF